MGEKPITPTGKGMNYELHSGDSAIVLRSIPDASIDLTVTSPPYDNLRAYNGFTFDFETIASELYRVTKPGGVVVWVVADATIKGSETGTSFRQALFFKECGFGLFDTMIYHKQNPLPRQHGARYEQAFEFMFVLAKGQPKTVNVRRVPCKYAGGKCASTSRDGGKDTLSGNQRRIIAETKFDSNVWGYRVGNQGKRDAGAKAHPGTFPDELAGDHIRSWSNPGDVVLDPFMGSGTTGKMALLTSRKFVGIEISDEYMALAKQRIAAATPVNDNHPISDSEWSATVDELIG